MDAMKLSVSKEFIISTQPIGCITHKSKQTERWLKKNPKFCLVFQPVYSPWVNHIERLWHKLHETITRNHQCRGMASLLARVKHFMDTVSPFPGNGYGTAKV